MKTQIELDNTCKCGAMVLLKRADNGDDICLGSWKRDGSYHSLRRCLPIAQARQYPRDATPFFGFVDIPPAAAA